MAVKVKANDRFGIRLVAIDIDGTFLDGNHNVPPENARAVKDAIDAGIHVVLASSRPPGAVSPLLNASAGVVSYFIACQGALVFEVDLKGTTRRLVDQPMSVTTAREIASMGHLLQSDVNWFSGERWFVANRSERVREEEGIVGLQSDVADLTQAPAPHKILLLTEPGREAKVVSELQSLPVRAEVSKPGYVEVSRDGVTKGSALTSLLRILNLESLEAMAIGDGLNDLAMFDAVGVSVAMANAPAVVREAANHITHSSDEAGVAAALRAFVIPG